MGKFKLVKESLNENIKIGPHEFKIINTDNGKVLASKRGILGRDNVFISWELLDKIKTLVKYEYFNQKRINERFVEYNDPLKELGIGVTNKIKKELKDNGYSYDNFEILGTGEIFTPYSFYEKSDNLIEIQLKYLPPQLKEFAKELINITIQKNKINELIPLLEKAYKNGISIKKIEKYIKEFGNNEMINVFKVIFKYKISRNKKEIEEDEEYNIYVFIGYNDKVPVIINGEKYYKDKFCAEKMIKIDKYNILDYRTIQLLKIRVTTVPNGKVYMVKIPKIFMNKEYYNKIPENYLYYIEKYKTPI